MSTITTTCRREYTPEHRAILRGGWRLCPACRPAAAPPDDPGTRCERCGRPLRAGKRSLCYACLTGGLPL